MTQWAHAKARIKRATLRILVFGISAHLILHESLIPHPSSLKPQAQAPQAQAHAPSSCRRSIITLPPSTGRAHRHKRSLCSVDSNLRIHLRGQVHRVRLHRGSPRCHARRPGIFCVGIGAGGGVRHAAPVRQEGRRPVVERRQHLVRKGDPGAQEDHAYFYVGVRLWLQP